MIFCPCRVITSQKLSADYHLLRLTGGEALRNSRAGQFAMLRGEWGQDPLLPRPYSIFWVEKDQVEFLIHRVGRGSRLLAQAHSGDTIYVLGPLGKGFPDSLPGVTDLLVAGGCGMASLFLALCKPEATSRKSHHIELLLGARRREDLILMDRLVNMGITVFSTTEDGSQGRTGVVTELLIERLTEIRSPARILACGSETMLRKVRDIAREHHVPCFLCVEANMACGMGACMGCAIPGRHKPYLHVCQDGPVFAADDIWP